MLDMDWSPLKTSEHTDSIRRTLFIHDDNFVVQIQADLDLKLFEETREKRWTHWVGFESKQNRKLTTDSVKLAAFVLELADEIGECMAGHTEESWEGAKDYLGRTTPDGIVYDAGNNGFCISGPNARPLLIGHLDALEIND
jgi:hypothetical protein